MTSGIRLVADAVLPCDGSGAVHRPGAVAVGADGRTFVVAAAACLAGALGGGLLDGAVRRARQQLSTRVFQLHNLFDASRGLTGSVDEQDVHGLVVTMAMGHFVVSRCALYLIGPEGLCLVHQRGLWGESESTPVPAEEARAALEGLVEAKEVAELPEDEEEDDTTRAVRAFNPYFSIHPQLKALVLPLGDGLGVATKVQPTVREMGGPF